MNMSIENDKVIMKQALDEAISIAGNQSALARMCGVKPQAVQQWVKKGFISRKRVKLVSVKTGIALERL